jgi:hypothetical protein
VDLKNAAVTIRIWCPSFSSWALTAGTAGATLPGTTAFRKNGSGNVVITNVVDCARIIVITRLVFNEVSQACKHIFFVGGSRNLNACVISCALVVVVTGQPCSHSFAAKSSYAKFDNADDSVVLAAVVVVVAALPHGVLSSAHWQAPFFCQH